jgi:hypothetical protein
MKGYNENNDASPKDIRHVSERYIAKFKDWCVIDGYNPIPLIVNVFIIYEISS